MPDAGPTDSPPRAPTYIAQADLDAIEQAYEAGRYHQAYELARVHGPFDTWQGPPALILGGRLVANLGAPKLARRLHTRAWRSARDNLEALCYYTRHYLMQGRPLAAWQRAAANGHLAAAAHVTSDDRADWLAVLAQIASQLRDFHAADRHMAEALALAPADPWLHVVHGQILLTQDRLDAAVEAVEAALALRPWFRPAVQLQADLLTLEDRPAAAREILRTARLQLEAGSVLLQLARLDIEAGDYALARESLDDLPHLWPLMEDQGRQFWLTQCAEAAYHLGDTETAAELYAATESPYHIHVGASLRRASPEAKRVVLPMPFVRQHRVTCAPATLSALTRYWGRPAEHLEIADEICYDGTSEESQRRWAEEAGWLVRVFTVGAATSLALIDRGLPFTLATLSADRGHLQAVMGYDTRLGTLLIRDPYISETVEMLMAEGLEAFRAFGPRGMVMVPGTETGRLAGLTLPDAELYDQTQVLQMALAAHDREGAAVARARLGELDPEHRLTLMADLALTNYDGDETGRLAAIQALLARYPVDNTLRLWELQCLQGLEQSEVRLERLATLAGAADGHPVFKELYAAELAADNRRRATVEGLLCRVIRTQPDNGRAYHLLGQVVLHQGRTEQALDLLRFATCLDDKVEPFATTYFTAARQAGQQRRALGLLRDRVERFGHLSSQPARTLHWALEDADRDVEAQAVLDAALVEHPEDGALLLYAASSAGQHGDLAMARHLLDQARDRVAAVAWERAAAMTAEQAGDLATAAEHWRAVVRAEPLDVTAHAALIRLLPVTAGPEAPIQELVTACRRFPHHYPLHVLWAETLDQYDPQGAIEVLHHILTSISPDSAWARRQLALALAGQADFEAARAQAELAAEIDPHSPGTEGVLGRVAWLAGDLDGAKRHFRAAVRREVHNPYLASGLMATSTSPAEAWQSLELIRGEVERQGGSGDGVMIYSHLADDVVSPERLLASLRRIHEARPDLWQTWSAIIGQHVSMGRLDEAKVYAAGLVDRFPYLPRAWFDKAYTHSVSQESEAEAHCLGRALALDPGYGEASLSLAQLRWANEERDAARQILETALRHNPRNGECQVALAKVLFLTGAPDLAIERLAQTLRLEPARADIWDHYAGVCQVVDQAERPIELARELTQYRPADADVWLALARLLDDPATTDEQLAAVERAAQLRPLDPDIHDLRASLLVGVGRMEEALAACSPPVFAGQAPFALRGRAAWVMARQGRLVEAVRQMTALVDEDPNYAFGWHWLATWQEALGQGAEYLVAMRRLAALDPETPVTLARVHEALATNGETAEAVAVLDQGLERFPTIPYFGVLLFRQKLDGDDLAAAEAVVERMAAAGANDLALLGCRIELAAKRGDHVTALDGFGELAAATTADEDDLIRAIQALTAAGWAPEAVAKLRQMGESKQPLHRIAAAWCVDSILDAGEGASARAFVHALRDQPGGRGASEGYMRWLAGRDDPVSRSQLATYLAEEADWLGQDSQSWGLAAWAYTYVDAQSAIAWTEDWRERDGVEAWMLGNRLHSLLELERFEEAHHLAVAVVGRPSLAPTDLGLPYFWAWLAFDHALAGRIAEARRALDATLNLDDEPDITLQLGMARALLVATLLAQGSGSATALRQARAEVEAAVKSHPRLAKDTTTAWLRGLHARYQARLDELTGGNQRGWFRRR